MKKRMIFIFVLAVLLVVGASAVMAFNRTSTGATYLKIKHELGKPAITDETSYMAVRAMQTSIVDGVDGSPSLNLTHPVEDIVCWDCHVDDPKGAQHSTVVLEDDNLDGTCGACHLGMGDLYEVLADMPYFTELEFDLAATGAVADAMTRVDNAITVDGTLDYSTLAQGGSKAKWEFEVNGEDASQGFPANFDGLIDKTADALEAIKDNHVTIAASGAMSETLPVATKIEAKVEAKGSQPEHLQHYLAELNTLDATVEAALDPTAVDLDRTIEGKWKPTPLPDEAKAFVNTTISDHFGDPTAVSDDKIEWKPPSGDSVGTGSIVAEFKLGETKIKFNKLDPADEDDALTALTAIAAEYTAVAPEFFKTEHKYSVKDTDTAANMLLIDTLESYKVSVLTDKGVKYEVKVHKGTDVFEDLVGFYEQKNSDHAGALSKVKTEFKWEPLGVDSYEYKTETMAFSPQAPPPLDDQSPIEEPAPPSQFAKIFFEAGKPNIVSDADFFIVRQMQSDVATTLGAPEGFHPFSDRTCWACHVGEPGGDVHSSVTLDEAAPTASCGTCHGLDELADMPFFHEPVWPLTDASSFVAAGAAVQQASVVVDNLPVGPEEYKWFFETAANDRYLEDSAAMDALIAVNKAEMIEIMNGLGLVSGSPEFEGKVESKASSPMMLESYFAEFQVLDAVVAAAAPVASIESTIEGKWKPTPLPDEAKTFVVDTLSAHFGDPTSSSETKVEWKPPAGSSAGVGQVEVEFKLHETKIKFKNIDPADNDAALAALQTVAAQYHAVPPDFSKGEHKDKPKNATADENIALIAAMQSYTPASFPDVEFKYEIKVKKDASDALGAAVLGFFDAKYGDVAGWAIKTKVELKWKTAVNDDFEYKIEVSANGNVLEGTVIQTPSATPLVYGDTVDVDVSLMNYAADIDSGSCILWLDDEITYANGSVYNATPLTAMKAADMLNHLGLEVPAAVDDHHGSSEVIGILWEGMLANGEMTEFGFTGMVNSTTGSIMHAANVFDGYMPVGTFVSESLEITETAMVELPLLTDTWVNGGDTATNFDDYAALVARTSGLDNVLLTFDRSALPKGANMISANLMVNVTLESGAFGKELTVLNTEAFDSTTVTYDDAPATYNPGEAVPVSVGMMTFDVGGNVAAWDAMSAQATTDGHIAQLVISGSGPWGRVTMDSLETWQAMPPTLMITYFVE